MNAIKHLANEAWAILPESLETIISVAKRTNEEPEAVAAKLGRPLSNARKVDVRDGVAIVPVVGPIFRRANLFTELSGATSIEVLATDFNAALENPNVESIVLDIDSPGGTVNGTSEFADMIFNARGTKPITAFVGGTGASAAFWIASAADNIVVNDTAMVGSIGTVLSIQDSSAKDEKAGIKNIEIVSSQSPNKRPDINSDEGRSQLQSLVDNLTTIFIDAVARNRGVTAEDVLSRFGQGGIFVGANAVEAGLADGVGSLESIIAGLTASDTSGAPLMKDNENKGEQEITRELIASSHPDIAEAFRAEGYEKGVTAGTEVETARIKAVHDLTGSSDDELIQAAMFDGKTTGPEAAQKILLAEKETREGKAKDIESDAPDAIDQEGEVDASEEGAKLKAAMVKGANGGKK